MLSALDRRPLAALALVGCIGEGLNTRTKEGRGWKSQDHSAVAQAEFHREISTAAASRKLVC